MRRKPESEWVYIPVEPIITEELWDACMRIWDEQKLRRRPTTKRATYLFAGFTFCACGTKMYVKSNSPKYICASCHNKIPISDLEAVYQEQLHHFLITPDEIEAHNRAAREALGEKECLVEAIHTELKKIEAEESVLIQLYADHALPKEAFKRRHEPLATRRAQLDEELPRLQAECDVLRINSFTREETIGEARSLTARWHSLPHEEKRQIVEAITERIVIAKDNIEISLLQLHGVSEYVAKGHTNDA